MQGYEDLDMLDPRQFTSDEGSEGKKEAFTDAIVRALKTVNDPEIPVDIYELGLIYDVRVEEGHAKAEMTLTAPGCPVAGSMPRMVELALMTVDGIESATVELVWDPPWNSSRMSEVARLELGLE